MAARYNYLLRISGERGMKTLAGTEWGLWAVMLLVASLIGISLALSIYEIPIFILAMMATLTLIAFPVVGVWVIIVGALIAFGLIDLYMPILRPLAWAVALLSMLIAAIALINAYFGQASAEVATKEGKGLVIWLFIFVLIVIFSSVANWHGIGGSVIGLKGYFQIWGLLIAIYYLMKSAHDSRRLISFFVLLGILQLPFALHQYLVLVPMRSSEILAAKNIVADRHRSRNFWWRYDGRWSQPKSCATVCGWSHYRTCAVALRSENNRECHFGYAAFAGADVYLRSQTFSGSSPHRPVPAV